jgi:transketolase
MLQHEMDIYKARWDAFGWQALVVDGHNIEALLDAYGKAAATKDRPTVVLARTFKGRGIAFRHPRPYHQFRPSPIFRPRCWGL